MAVCLNKNKINWFTLNFTEFVNRSKKGSCRLVERNVKKYDSGASKHVYNIVTGGEAWIHAYELECKRRSTVWLFKDEPNLIKVVRVRKTSKQIVAYCLRTRTT